MIVVPNNMPRRGSTVFKKLGKLLLRLSGWTLTGEIPNEKKLLIAAVPHTSNWDFFYGIPMLLAYDINIAIMMKKEAFFWPFTGLWQWLGFVPIDRQQGRGVVDSAVEYFTTNDALWLLMTPEGTRSHVTQWKSGFLRIAHKANIPVLTMAWNYPTKTVHFGQVILSQGNYEQELFELQNYFSQFDGKNSCK